MNTSPPLAYRVKKAMIMRDPVALVEVLNDALTVFKKIDFGEVPLDHDFFCIQLMLLFISADVDTMSEVNLSLGSPDFVCKIGGQTWILEIKVNKNDKVPDEVLAKKTLKQIVDRNYGGGFRNPILLGLVINSKDWLIKAWESLGGLS
ncbi:MAG: hypothetical protein LBF22_14030 [Deltaproteobacteria bacterium]|jgi:hypothetical protein|nr:hypothetical protein [Deltaproteobacteria bacterium]